MQRATWIWPTNKERADEYAQFYDNFEAASGNVTVRISADSDYVLYVNGNVAAFGQYRSFPTHRVYDEVDITPFVHAGSNAVCISVWYCGHDSMTYMKGTHGLIYEIFSGNTVLAYSGRHTKCRIAPDFVSYREKEITTQLGLSFCYDASKYDGFGDKDFVPAGFSDAVIVSDAGQLYARPNRKLELLPTSYAELVHRERRIYDLGEEKAGLLHIRFSAPKGCLVTVVFGEYIAQDGNLMRYYDHQDYSLQFTGSGQAFEFVGYMRRIGCRYFQIFSQETDIDFIGMKETPYPVEEKPFSTTSSVFARIYQTGVRTLRLCMHEHYEDCPWREQTLYPLDSRNMMLCSYYAFGEYEYARSNLWLMSKAPLYDGLLPACMPSGVHSVIPFYSLMFILQMQEYVTFSGDTSLAKENLPLMEGLLSTFAANATDDGLVREFAQFWNFYEWNEWLNGQGTTVTDGVALPLNCFYIMAQQSMNAVYKALGVKKNYDKQIAQRQNAVRTHFWSEKDGLFRSYAGCDTFSALGNSLAILSGCASDKAERIAKRIVGGGLQPTSLAMKIFEYEALYGVSSTYREYIVSDFSAAYLYMLNNGATSFWETLDGAELYGGAGSLCHGWSAMPIVYLHRYVYNERASDEELGKLPVHPQAAFARCG